MSARTYSKIEVVNTLTALLVAHGVRHAVVCPGSRNAPICHNLNEAPEIECHPMIDERSAAFTAIGISQGLGMAPVAVCVTSGSALLDVAPAAAEAYYQHVPLIIISADRPLAWIDQLDGQTLPQEGALGKMVRLSVSLPECTTSEEHWHANRLINEAMMEAMGETRGPVHINVPLHEPLYEFGRAELPQERVCRKFTSGASAAATERLAEWLSSAKRPMIIVGQTPLGALKEESVGKLKERWPLMSEPLSGIGGCRANEVIHLAKTCQGLKGLKEPDVVIYVGGHIVSKGLKAYIRGIEGCQSVMVSADGRLHDLFMNTVEVIPLSEADAIEALATVEEGKADREYVETWRALIDEANALCDTEGEVKEFSQLQVMRHLAARGIVFRQVANSSVVRLACITQSEPFFCNRGVNGIDGSTSAAAGFSLTRPQGELTFFATGDLSLLYDANGLMNEELDGRLRIVLLNNRGGGIFSRFEGLKGSGARDKIVMARHDFAIGERMGTRGVECERARNIKELDDKISWLTEVESVTRPRLLEVETDIDSDARAMEQFYKQITRAYDKRVGKS